MKIQNIENKIKFVSFLTICFIIGSVVISIASMQYAKSVQNQAYNNVYVLDNGIPLLIKRTQIGVNREAEYKSHVSMYHYLFFNLPPDEKYIKKNMESAMYLIDDTGLMEYNNLREKSYFSRILSTSTVLSISTDSVTLKDNTFTYYGTQRIDRKSSVIIRKIQTVGSLRDIPRSDNNPHGVLIENWKTILNKDVSIKKKRDI